MAEVHIDGLAREHHERLRTVENGRTEEGYVTTRIIARVNSDGGILEREGIAGKRDRIRVRYAGNVSISVHVVVEAIVGKIHIRVQGGNHHERFIPLERSRSVKGDIRSRVALGIDVDRRVPEGQRAARRGGRIGGQTRYITIWSYAEGNAGVSQVDSIVAGR